MANLKITQLTEETSPVGADLIAIVDDVAGTPTTKKVTLTNLATLMGTLAPGGDSTHTSAHAAPPGSPGAGDLWLPNDSFYAYRYTGSVWVPWGPIFPMAPPDNSLFSWVNQGSAAVSVVNGGIFLSTPQGGATAEARIRVMAAPATPYTVTAAFMTNHPVVSYRECGLLFRQSSDGKLATFATYYENGPTPHIESKKWSAANFPGAFYYKHPMGGPRQLYWLQISDNGTDRICRWSQDGQNWVTVHSVGRTDYLTADQIGFFVNAQNVSNAFDTGDMTLLSWKVT